MKTDQGQGNPGILNIPSASVTGVLRPPCPARVGPWAGSPRFRLVRKPTRGSGRDGCRRYLPVSPALSSETAHENWGVSAEKENWIPASQKFCGVFLKYSIQSGFVLIEKQKRMQEASSLEAPHMRVFWAEEHRPRLRWLLTSLVAAHQLGGCACSAEFARATGRSWQLRGLLGTQ